METSTGADFIGGMPRDWLVVGWFTPGPYRDLAGTFAANLAEHQVPYHLFAKPALDGWNTCRKPAVVLEAMDLYPGRTIVLMDVDCVVRENIAPAAQIDSDIGIIVLARNMRRKGRTAHWLAVECSSRVVVFRPTEKARGFAQTWADAIERSEFSHDEHSMVWAYLKSPSIDFSFIDQQYSAREIGLIEGAVIEHDSAHDDQRRAARGRIKTALRTLEKRFFRTGLTRRARLKGEMSVILKAT